MFDHSEDVGIPAAPSSSHNGDMAFYVIEYRYDPALMNLVSDFRPAHRTYLREMEVQGRLISSGFLRDSGYEGAMLIVSAESAADALKLLDEDPFSLNGLIQDIRARQWIPTIGSLAEDFDTQFPIS